MLPRTVGDPGSPKRLLVCLCAHMCLRMSTSFVLSKQRPDACVASHHHASLRKSPQVADVRLPGSHSPQLFQLAPSSSLVPLFLCSPTATSCRAVFPSRRSARRPRRAALETTADVGESRTQDPKVRKRNTEIRKITSHTEHQSRRAPRAASRGDIPSHALFIWDYRYAEHAGESAEPLAVYDPSAPRDAKSRAERR